MYNFDMICLDMIIEDSSRFLHDLLHFILLYTIHFLLLIIIRFKNIILHLGNKS